MNVRQAKKILTRSPLAGNETPTPDNLPWKWTTWHKAHIRWCQYCRKSRMQKKLGFVAFTNKPYKVKLSTTYGVFGRR